MDVMSEINAFIHNNDDANDSEIVITLKCDSWVALQLEGRPMSC